MSDPKSIVGTLFPKIKTADIEDSSKIYDSRSICTETLDGRQ